MKPLLMLSQRLKNNIIRNSFHLLYPNWTARHVKNLQDKSSQKNRYKLKRSSWFLWKKLKLNMRNFKWKFSKEKAHKWIGYKIGFKWIIKMIKMSLIQVWWLSTLFFLTFSAILSLTIWTVFSITLKSNMALLIAQSFKEL